MSTTVEGPQRGRGLRNLMEVLGWACAAIVLVDAATGAVPQRTSRAEVVAIGVVAVVAWLVSLVDRARDQRVIAAAVAVTGLLGSWVQWIAPSGPGVLLAFMAMACAGLRLARRAAVAVGVPVIVAAGVAQAHTSSHPWSAALSLAAGAGFLFLASAYAGLSRDASTRAEALLQQEAATRAAREEAAVLAERSRLARELHDVLAHSLAGLAVQLEGARLLAGHTAADPRLVDQLALAQRLARDGLAGAKRAVSTLRGEPLPGPDDVPALVEQARLTGHPARLTTTGAPCALPAELGLAVYRTVQEGITNATKYAGADAPIDVRVDWSDDEVVVMVTNGAGHAVPGGQTPRGERQAGQYKRARLAGGRVDAGPDDAGWTVRLALPLHGAGTA
ncbi:MAG: sensor histidine kinase [Jatrophihabitans sp.]|uniref:sensor histidine kinase n=1 Tax=Jatrophihabitans sp. TaxID=1932789 RepID=UPI003F80015A